MHCTHSPWPVSASERVSCVGVNHKAWNLLDNRQQTVLELLAGREKLQVDNHVLVVVRSYWDIGQRESVEYVVIPELL